MCEAPYIFKNLIKCTCPLRTMDTECTSVAVVSIDDAKVKDQKWRNINVCKKCNGYHPHYSKFIKTYKVYIKVWNTDPFNKICKCGRYWIEHFHVANLEAHDFWNANKSTQDDFQLMQRLAQIIEESRKQSIRMLEIAQYCYQEISVLANRAPSQSDIISESNVYLLNDLSTIISNYIFRNPLPPLYV